MPAIFAELVREWQGWATSADKRESGWQSDFPQWGLLMEAAADAMMEIPIDPDTLALIEFCWCISEESEVLAEVARDHRDECWSLLSFLATASCWTVRWQAYDVLGDCGARADDLLHAALHDSNAYCRRRALLSLARIRPKDARALVDHYIEDSDPYMRQAVISLVETIGDAAFTRAVRERLLHDEAWHVRLTAGAMDEG